jgi:hypothetical protein
VSNLKGKEGEAEEGSYASAGAHSFAPPAGWEDAILLRTTRNNICFTQSRKDAKRRKPQRHAEQMLPGLLSFFAALREIRLPGGRRPE